MRFVAQRRPQHLLDQSAKGLALGRRQAGQGVAQGSLPVVQQASAQLVAGARQVQRHGTAIVIRRFTPDKSVILQAVDEPHSPRVGETERAAQALDGHARLVSDQPKRRRGVAPLGRAGIGCAGDVVGDGKRKRSEEIFRTQLAHLPDYMRDALTAAMERRDNYICAPHINSRDTDMQTPAGTQRAANPAVGRATVPAGRLLGAGRAIALAGVFLPLLLIGILKFTAIEIEALGPLVSGTPWLAWLYRVLGQAGTSYFLGVFEILAAVCLAVAPWAPRLGVLGGAMGGITFLSTCSIMLALPIWEEKSGGFPFLNDVGTFLIKDVALLGIALTIGAESLGRVTVGTRRTDAAPDI